MAFFTSHLGGATRNDALANMIARKKEKEQESIAKWENHSQYLNNSNVRAMKEKHWTSTQSYDTSMQAFQFQSNDSETEIWLKQRREKLRVILDSELTEQENALKRISDKPKDKTCMILRSTVLKQSREDERTKLAQKLLREQFLNNNHDYKNMVSSAKQKEVVSAWDCQRNELREQAQEDCVQQIVQQEAELEGQTYQEKLNEQAEMQRLRARQQQLESLQKQLDEIHLREEEAKKLVSKENALADDLALLDKLEKDRRAIEEHCKRELYGRALLRQHHAAIRRRSAVVQAELEADLAWLAQLESQKIAGAKAEAERKKLTHQNIEAMRELLEADLDKERKQEIELDAMQSHEATKWWAKREQEWRNEAEARQQLLREVLEERRSQIAEQLEKVRQQQQEELKSREALLESLEQAKNEDVIQSEKKLEADEAYRLGLDAQAEEKRAASAYALEQSELEKLETVKAEEAYEELLKQEAEQLRCTESAKDRSISSRQTHFPYQWSKPGGNIW